jgi:hypothetical protein
LITDRRRFLGLMGTGAVAGVAAATAPASSASAATSPATYGGPTLSDWTTVLGDGLYAASGASWPTTADIAAEHRTADSRLRANVANRGVMAHIITFKRFTDPSMMTTAHQASYSFRLSYVPSTAGGALNAQTVEGGLFVWDGLDTRLDHGTAFQWILNPWMPNFGQIMAWSGTNGGSWTPAGYLKPDTTAHTVAMSVDPARRLVSLAIDAATLPAPYSAIAKKGWGTDVSARLQAEAISIWPGSAAAWAPQHEVLVNNWNWTQTPGGTA